MSKLTIVRTEMQSLAYTNCVFINSTTHSLIGKPSHVMIEGYPFCVNFNQSIPDNSIFVNRVHRDLLFLSLNTEYEVTKINSVDGFFTKIFSVTVTVNTLVKTTPTVSCDKEKLDELVRKQFSKLIMIEGSTFCIDYIGTSLKLVFTGFLKKQPTNAISAMTAAAMSAIKSKQDIFILDDDTILNFRVANDQKNIKFDNDVPSLFKEDLNLQELGIGGLDDQFAEMFRRAFASRALPKKVIEGLGTKHVKGILLYGPPGTGKTLIARQIGKILNCREPKIVQGPSLLNKYVGQSEENVRELFADSIKYPDELHLIIVDELDALCKQRGSNSSSTGVGDNIVNQFLTMMDGPKPLPNVLTIGMTNRRDLIDEAMLRPGRLEVQIHIGLPDTKGRIAILEIHTKTMKQNNYLDGGADIKNIAEKTVNYTGAEIEGLVKNATSFAISRVVNADNVKETIKNDKLRPIVYQTDFEKALDGIKPMFGNISDEINQYTKSPFIMWSDELAGIYTDIIKYINNLKFGNVLSVVVQGSSNIGKTKLLAKIAKESGIPCIKMITADKLLRVGDKSNYIISEFDKCCSASESILILDNIERILEWNSYGGRYDNKITQTLMTLIRKQMNENNKLIIMMTALNADVLTNLEIDGLIDYTYELPEKIKSSDAVYVLNEYCKNLENIDEKSKNMYISKLTKELTHDVPKLFRGLKTL
ncbi:MAG: putative vesicle-fusion ATPase [Terrestrivirus sp.]|uniref:Putative vesicle-fusion ATPase n=1 Tax=Terrestrivirus sp. TaxID=2487775 RepID=A0A3G4ZL69_9VIRU|nr:MAG: putative vesicle-fusion ATPase [Terrestrivirus sp.]